MTTFIGRRQFLESSLVLSCATAGPLLAAAPAQSLRIGVITDIHYADKRPGGSRHYRESIEKMKQAVKAFNQDKVDFVIELGDLIDAAGGSIDAEISFLKTIEAEYAKCAAPRHYVYGNHCLDMLTRKEFSAHSQAKEKGYYSFDQGHYHFVVLDSCYTSTGEPYARKNFRWTDANVPKKQLSWLEADLAATPHPTIVFVHQRLDVAHQHAVKNASAVRRILEASNKVLAVFQGHSHKNEYQQINGIHYTTIRGMVEGKGLASNGFTELLLDPRGSIIVKGFVKQKSYQWG